MIWKALKKLAFFTFAMALVLIVSTGLSKAATVDDLTFTLESNGKSYSVTDCAESASGEIVIPATYNGKPVTTIGDYAFQYCSCLTAVTIPDSVTTIGDYAFQYCSCLTAVTIPDSVTTIGDYAFQYCSCLTAVTIPDSVTTIGDCAFYDCDSLTAVTIGNSVTSIGYRAFYDCDSLTAVTIGNSVTTIGEYAFYSCSCLTAVTIPDGVTIIDDSAFSSCGSLTAVTIGNSVTTIGYMAFYDCTSLTAVTIGNSVTTIDYMAFYDCISLTAVTIPDSVTTIGNSAFSYCTRLTAVTIPDGVTTIGNSTFSYCTSLTTVTIPDSVTTIGDYAFYFCDSLTAVTIPDSVTAIGDQAFDCCDNLKHVAYGGTEAQWYEISIGSLNTRLTNATRHYEVTEDQVYYTKNCVNAGMFCAVCNDFVTKESASSGSHTYDDDSDLYCDDCEYTRSPKSITVSTKPSSTKFDWFTGTLDVTGGRLKVTYSDNSTGYADMTLDMVTGFDNTKLGDQTLTVTHGGKTATYSVEIVPGTPEHLEIVTLPEQLSYLVGQTPNLTGITAKAIYSQGEAEISSTDLTMDGISLSSAGEHTVTVRFKDVPATYTVFVHEKSAVTIDSSLYPESSHNYASNTNETKTFTSPGAGQLVLTFSSDSYMESDYDFVYVLDGDGNEIAKLSGNLSGKTVTVPGDTVQINLTSDSSVNKYGYAFSSIVAETILHPETEMPATVTCTEAGMTAGAKCEICDMVLVEPQPAEALGHNFVDGICETCGEVDIPKEPVHVTIPGVEGTFASLADVIAAYDPATQYIQLTGDVAVDLTLTKDLKIDLNGFTLSGVIDLNGNAVYGVDNSTDGYTCETIGYFNCVDEKGEPVAPAAHFKTDKATYGAIKRYLAVQDENGWSFHRFYFGITHATLNTANSGIGYKAAFAGDEMVKAALGRTGAYGIQLSAEEDFSACVTTRFAAFEFPKAGVAQTRTLLLKNVIKSGMSVEEMSANAAMPIYARTYLETADGTVIDSSVVQISLQTLVQAADRNYAGLTPAQQLSLKAFCATYADLFKDWELENI